MLQMIKYLLGYEDVAFRSQKLFKHLKYQVGQDPHRLYCLRDWDRILIEDAEWFPKFATIE